MHLRLLAIFVLLCSAQCCLADTALEDLAVLMQGRFDSHLPGIATDVPLDERIIDSRQQIAAPQIGALVVYLQLNRGAGLDLYRQRVLVFDVGADGAVTQQAFTLSEPERFIDANTGDAVLLDLSRDDLEPLLSNGCEQVWLRRDDGFRGYVDPDTCIIISSRTGKPRRIEAETLLNSGTLVLVERGYDEGFNQLFGTPPGEHAVLHKMAVEEQRGSEITPR